MSQHSHHHDVSRTTHTPELAQVRELNEHLAAATRAGTAVTAADLDLAGRADGGSGGTASGGLAPGAVLDHLSAEGPPDFPYIEGRFRGAGGGGGDLVGVEMHTAALRRLSETFHLRHVWGA